MDFLNVFLNKTDNEPLYYQLYKELGRMIRAGEAPAGGKLPGKRTAAGQLGVSVNTVDEAYQMLAAEGYVEAVPRSGFVVRHIEGLLPAEGQAAGTVAEEGPAAPAVEAGLAGKMPGGGQSGEPSSGFSTGGLDVGLFPLKTWTRLLKEELGRPGAAALFGRGAGGGDAVLRTALADYLHSYRGARCTAGQLVVGAGLELLTGMLGRLLAEGTVAVEDPGYPKTARVLRNMGLKVVPVPVDGDGMVPAALEESGAQVAYLTPSHQFPTGGVMPVGRRTELLAWAARGGRLIVEDDYDSEFRFDGRPLPCLQGLDGAGRVVYAGTFSRSLAPGLRAAYLVLPPWLLARWQAAYGDYACTISRPEQHTLASLMQGGHFARGLNRMRATYRKRRDLLVQTLCEKLAHRPYSIENAHTGLYLILRLPGQKAQDIAARARENGLQLRALDDYRLAPAPTKNSQTADALVLGYGGLAGEGIPDAVEKLLKMVENS